MNVIILAEIKSWLALTYIYGHQLKSAYTNQKKCSKTEQSDAVNYIVFNKYQSSTLALVLASSTMPTINTRQVYVCVLLVTLSRSRKTK
jgi:hypothetical protein